MEQRPKTIACYLLAVEFKLIRCVRECEVCIGGDEGMLVGNMARDPPTQIPFHPASHPSPLPLGEPIVWHIREKSEVHYVHDFSISVSCVFLPVYYLSRFL